jgi:polar amino acid transport system permease protein
MTAMLKALPFLWQGLSVTLQVSAIVVVIALVLGVLFGTALTYAPRWVAWPVRAYSDIARGLPLITLIFFVYYAMPALKVNVSGWWAAVSALAAFEIGLTFEQRMLYVIFPQALRRFLPPWINTVVDTVKGSALVSLVGIVDLMLAVQQVIGRTFQPLPLYVLGALIYFAINYTLSQLSRRLEARFAYVRE